MNKKIQEEKIEYLNSLEQKINYLFSFLTEKRKKRFLDVLNNRMRYITVVLEDISDPHNASACIRSCEANGIQDVYVIERNHTFSLKEGTAMGVGKWIDVIKYKSKEKDPSIECYEYLQKKGYILYGMSPNTVANKINLSLEEVPIDAPIALVFGSELRGLSEISKEYFKNFINIPMYGFIESYNISVSCAIAVYTLVSKIRKSNLLWYLSEIEKQEILYRWLLREFPYLVLDINS